MGRAVLVLLLHVCWSAQCGESAEVVMHAGLCMVRLLIPVLRSGQTAASVCCCVAGARAAAMHLIKGSQLQVLHRAALCNLLLSGLGKSLSWSRWNFLPFVLCACPLGADHVGGGGGIAVQMPRFGWFSWLD
jgi:hypothetical protein